jgi:Ca2+-binding EF-hand superfamily protein
MRVALLGSSQVRRVASIVAFAALCPLAGTGAAEKGAPDPEKIFARKDADSDGALTLEEYKAGLKEKALANADKRFKKIDSDGNGKLSLEEFKAGLPAKKE